MEAARLVIRRSVVVPAVEAELDRNLLDLDLREAGAPDELLDPLRLAERELAGVAGDGRLHQPTLDQRRPVGGRPRVPLRGRPGGERECAGRGGARGAPRGTPVRDPARACTRTARRPRRRSRPAGRSPACPSARCSAFGIPRFRAASTIAGERSVAIDVRDAAGQRFDEVAGAACEVEHDVVRLRVECGDERRRHGRVHLRDRLALRLPADRGGIPALPELLIHCALYPASASDLRLLPVRTQEIVVLRRPLILLVLTLRRPRGAPGRRATPSRSPAARSTRAAGRRATCAGTWPEPSCRCRSRSAR